MTPAEFDAALQRLWPKILALVLEKNAEYAGAGPDADTLKCWRKHGLAGMRVRMHDKDVRFDTFVERGGADFEAWLELLMDLAGYSACMLVWLLHGEDALVLSDEVRRCINCGRRRAGTKLHPDRDWCYECQKFLAWSSQAAGHDQRGEPLPDGKEFARRYAELTGDGPIDGEEDPDE